jgi:hypothetical protein
LRSNPEWSVKDDQSVTLAHGGKEEQNVLQHKPITDFFGSVTQVGISNSVGFQRR